MATVTFCTTGDSLIAYLAGEIDHHSAQLLREKIDGQAVSRAPQLLVLDFSGVSFMDSSGIGLILGRVQCMRGLGAELRVMNVPESVQKILRLAGIGSGEAVR